MKCGVCSALESKRHTRMLKEGKDFEWSKIPEASGSFKTSDGLTIYICYQHFTANRAHLEKVVKSL